MQNSAFRPDNLKLAQTRAPKRRSPLVIFILFIALILTVGGGVFLWQRSKYLNALDRPNSDSSEKVLFVIDPGDTPEAVADGLIELNLLQKESRTYFLLYLKLSKQDSLIQAGQFRLPKNLTIKELALGLQNAGIPTVWVTIPEGKRYDEIAEIVLNEFSGYEVVQFDKDKFITYFDDQAYIAQLGLTPAPTLEGYLFPDKYLFSVEASTEQVIEKMVENFKEKVGDSYTYEDLVIASLIEREAKNQEQRYIISDIIHKRVNEGWFLGIDAANLYYHGDWKYELTYIDLEEDHPYNTRTRVGLPPTPICSPGLSSLQAAQSPEETSYYYYIHDKNNVMYPARTLAEHNSNIAKYLQ